MAPYPRTYCNFWSTGTAGRRPTFTCRLCVTSSSLRIGDQTNLIRCRKIPTTTLVNIRIKMEYDFACLRRRTGSSAASTISEADRAELRVNVLSPVVSLAYDGACA